MLQKKIDSELAYEKAIAQIEVYLQKGFANLTTEETAQLQEISQCVATYEREYYPMPVPSTLSEMIQLKMFEMKLSQRKLAEILTIAPEKLSLILNGKRQPDVSFLKAVHQKLGVDANFLLNHC
jgi:HTH-type transcriptional regulator/antitoxin HigA